MDPKKSPPTSFYAARRIQEKLFFDLPTGKWATHLEDWADELWSARQRYYGPRVAGESYKVALAGSRAGGTAQISAIGIDVVGSLEIVSGRSQNYPDFDRLSEELGLRRDLLEVLAAHFGHDNLTASDFELMQFLKARAADYRSLRAQLSSLALDERKISDALNAADAEIEAFEFSKAESILAHLEDVLQSEKTLKHVRVQSRIRAARANAELLADKHDSAFQHFDAAARFFGPFDRFEEARNRIEFADRFRLYRHSGGLLYVAKLLRENLTIFPEDSLEWAETQIAIGDALTAAVGVLDFAKDGMFSLFEEGVKALREGTTAARPLLNPQSLIEKEEKLALMLVVEGEYKAILNRSDADLSFRYALKAIHSLIAVALTTGDAERWRENKIWLSDCMLLCALAGDLSNVRELCVSASESIRDFINDCGDDYPLRADRYREKLETLDSILTSSNAGLVRDRLASEIHLPVHYIYLA